jgi:hypothetical protein
MGGAKVGEIYKDGTRWAAALGEDTSALDGGHTHQRGALSALIGAYNRGTTTAFRKAAQGQPLIPAPAQTPLMQRFGVPAVTALATPASGSSDGPRVTTSDSSPAGLSPKGVTIYKKLVAKGFPPARALTFARRAQNFGG